MTRNQLPEGVGKKIVEALKRQAEADITPVEEANNQITNSIPLTDIQELPDIKIDTLSEEADTNDNFIIEEEIPTLPLGVNNKKEEGIFSANLTEKPVVKETLNTGMEPKITPTEKQQTSPIFTNIPNNQNMTAQTISTLQIQKPVIPPSAIAPINIPSNVAVLKNLIASLPVGVTKQIGAQIIRQTLEAMGLPMNSVLKEAQEVQEELNSSTRECMLKIQEFKTNILQLEQSVQEYQRNITQINDLVSLFLLTDKN